jgi:hypothetical protein
MASAAIPVMNSLGAARRALREVDEASALCASTTCNCDERTTAASNTLKLVEIDTALPATQPLLKYIMLTLEACDKDTETAEDIRTTLTKLLKPVVVSLLGNHADTREAVGREAAFMHADAVRPFWDTARAVLPHATVVELEAQWIGTMLHSLGIFHTPAIMAGYVAKEFPMVAAAPGAFVGRVWEYEWTNTSGEAVWFHSLDDLRAVCEETMASITQMLQAGYTPPVGFVLRVRDTLQAAVATVPAAEHAAGHAWLRTVLSTMLQRIKDGQGAARDLVAAAKTQTMALVF